MTWRRLYHLVVHLPPDAAVVRAQLGEAGEWTVGEHLLANVVDALNVANWQRSARKGSRPPKPMPRPGATPAAARHRSKRSYTPDEMDALRATLPKEG